MKIVSVTVDEYRSITSARKIPISDLTTLIGPNNEGKSNILRALILVMNTIQKWQSGLSIRLKSGALLRRQRSRQNYNWEIDYPIKLQNKSGSRKSKITVEFEFNQKEISEFRQSIGSSINGTLPVQFEYGKEDGEIVANIPKPGRGNKTLNSKVDKIISFVASRVETQYIPAVRTASSANSIVSQLVESALKEVEVNEIYKQALADIAKVQQPILDKLSQSITETIKLFMPNINTVTVSIREQERAVALRNIAEISLDDGVDTSLEYKGDGVQSLAALALMRHASQTAQEGKDVLIALEEPESHLHPYAIRQFREVLLDLSRRHQVVISTHNPIFVNRADVKQNIIVQKNRAFSAKTVADIRQVLGVNISDNLMSAEVVLIVEGEDDRVALRSILSAKDKILETAIESGRLAIDIMGGAGNLNHRIRLHGEGLCRVHVLLDDDQSGRKAQTAAFEEKLLIAQSVNLTVVGGKVEAELEDLYDAAVYEDILREETGFSWVKTGPDAAKKWADRVRTMLKKAGKPNDEAALMIIKLRVAQRAAMLKADALVPGRSGPIDSMITSLKSHLSPPT